jgi:hypothetical protein
MQVYQGPGFESIWTGISPAQRTALYDGYARAYLDVVEKFKPQQFWNAGVANPKVGPNTINPMVKDYGSRIWYTIPLFKYFGVNQPLIDEFIAWAKTVWPAGNWDHLNTATCSFGGWGIGCSTEH